MRIKFSTSKGKRRGQFGFGFDIGWDSLSNFPLHWGIDLSIHFAVWYWGGELWLER
jgi:hypothetical protein